MFYDLPEKTGKLARRVALGATFGLAAFLTGCSTTTKLKNDNLLYGSTLGTVSSASAPYSIQIIRHTGKDFVLEMGFREVQNGELGIVAWDYNGGENKDAWINKDRKNGTFNFESANFFVITPYMVKEGAVEKPATKAFFNQKGPYGLEAKITGIREFGDYKLGLREYTHKNLVSDIRVNFISLLE